MQSISRLAFFIRFSLPNHLAFRSYGRSLFGAVYGALRSRPYSRGWRLFDVRCDALLIDLRGKDAFFPDLVNRQSYAFTQSFGNFLVDQGTNGILVPSARCSGINGAILKRERLSNVRDKMLLTYRCNPMQDLCTVERTTGQVWLRVKPSSLY